MRIIGILLLNFLMFITISKISLIFVPFVKDLTLDSWIVGPSAMGSEKGIPISIISIPLLIMVLRISKLVLKSGSPPVVKVTNFFPFVSKIYLILSDVII